MIGTAPKITKPELREFADSVAAAAVRARDYQWTGERVTFNLKGFHVTCNNDSKAIEALAARLRKADFSTGSKNVRLPRHPTSTAPTVSWTVVESFLTDPDSEKKTCVSNALNAIDAMGEAVHTGAEVKGGLPILYIRAKPVPGWPLVVAATYENGRMRWRVLEPVIGAAIGGNVNAYTEKEALTRFAETCKAASITVERVESRVRELQAKGAPTPQEREHQLRAWCAGG